MGRINSLKLIGIACIFGFFIAVPVLFAQDEDDPFDSVSGDSYESSESSGETPATAVKEEKSELDVVSDICSKLSDEKNGKGFYLQKQGKGWKAMVQGNRDPFRPIIEKKAPPAPVARRPQDVKPIEKPKPAAPPIQPIKLAVNGIVGNEGKRLAIVVFEGQEMTVLKDQIVEGKFKVVDIYADRVVVYSNKEQRRHTFKIGGDEKS